MVKIFSIVLWTTLFLLNQAHSGPAANALDYERTSDGKVNKELEQLSEAIRLGNLGFLGRYVDQGGKIDRAWVEAPGAVSLNLWQRALWAGRFDVFLFLVKKGAQIDIEDPRTNEGLLIAIRSCQPEVIETLTKNGVVIGKANRQEALAASVESKQLECLKIVLSKGAKIDRNSPEIDMSLVTNEMIQYLVPTYLSADARAILPMNCESRKIFRPKEPFEGCEGYPPNPIWMEYVFRGDSKMVAFFKERRANFKTKGEIYLTNEKLRFTAVELAEAKKDANMVRLLNSYGSARH